MSELAKPVAVVPSTHHELPAETAGILRIFGRNTMWLWVDLGALRVGTMLAGLFLIRYFGPTEFGVYSAAIAAGWIANAVVDLGLTRYAARAVAASSEEARPILALCLLATVGSVVLEILVLIIAAQTGHWEIACFAAGFVLCNFEGTASLCSSVLTADLRSRAVLPGSILGASGLIIATIFVVVFHLSVLTALALLCFKSFLVATVRMWQVRSHWPLNSDWSWSHLIGVARRALPYFSYNLIQVGYGRVAILCFGIVAAPDKVGWFAAGFVLSDIVPQWSYAASGALLPVWTRLFETSRVDELLALRQRLLDIVLFLSVPLWISLALFAPQICELLGSRYSASAPVLRILACRSVLAVLDGFLGHGFLVAVNRVKERQTAQARSLVALAVLSLVFGYIWGPVGVAVALFVSDSTLILQYLRITSRVGLSIQWPSTAPSLLAGAAMAISVLLLPAETAFAIKLATAFVSYALALALFSRGRLISACRTLRECAS